MPALLRSLLAVAVLALAGPALCEPSSPFSLDDLLQQEAFGNVRFSPDGQWVVVERQAAWAEAATYRFGFYTPWLLSGLEVSRADGSGAGRRLRDPGQAAGYVSGPFSPHGSRMALYRLSAEGWRLGVMTMATGAVAWFPITPETPRLGRTVAWRSETELVAIIRPDDSLPFVLRFSAKTQDETALLWARAAAGRVPSASFIPSGSARDTRAHGRTPRLIVLEVPSGRERIVAEGDFFDLEVSPDGRAVAALMDAEDIQAPADVPAVTGSPTRRRRLIVAELNHGAAREPLPDRDFVSHLLTWSSDSRRLLAFARRAGAAFETGEFWSIDPNGRAEAIDLGDAAPWIDATGEGIPLVYGGWDGRHPVVQVRQPSGARAWARFDHGRSIGTAEVTVPGETLAAGGGGLAIRRGDGLYPFGGSRLSIAGRPWDPGNAPDGGDRANRNPDPVELGLRPLIDPEGCVALAARPVRNCLSPLLERETVVAVSPDGRYLVGRVRSPGGSTALFIHSVGRVRPLATLNAFLETRAWGEIKAIVHPGRDGRMLTSWLLLPDGPAGTRPPPVVVLIYPGADYRTAPSWLQPGGERRHINPAVLASAGYAILVPSLPDLAGSPVARDDLADRVLAIVDQAAATGIVDGSRVALVGHSFGAYGALLAATQSDRFSAVVASNGYADLSRSAELPAPWRVSPIDGLPIYPLSAWAETGQAAVGVSFGADPQAYVDRSPLYAAARITAATLLIESDLDGARLGALFSTLYRMNREAGLVTYFGEGHSYVSPANLRDLHSRIIAWLDRYMGSSHPVDPALPPADPDLQDRQNEEAIAGSVPD